MFGKSIAWVSQHAVLLQLVPSVQERINDDLPEGARIGLMLGLEIAKLPAGHQEAAASHILKHKLSIDRARHFVRVMSHQVGVAAGKHSRRGPDDDYRNLARFISRTLAQAEIFLAIPGMPLGRIFASRVQLDKREAVEKLARIVKACEAMRAEISAASSLMRKG